MNTHTNEMRTNSGVENQLHSLQRRRDCNWKLPEYIKEVSNSEPVLRWRIHVFYVVIQHELNAAHLESNLAYVEYRFPFNLRNFRSIEELQSRSLLLFVVEMAEIVEKEFL